jgi:exodeoxyribonuclease-3
MKITTWNVNGIRAAAKKGAFTWAQNFAPDVFCLQEVKAREDQLDPADHKLPGYVSYWNAAQRPGYSGVATYTRLEPLEFNFGLGDDRFDDEGRVIRMRFPDFWLYNIYFRMAVAARSALITSSIFMPACWSSATCCTPGASR